MRLLFIIPAEILYDSVILYLFCEKQPSFMVMVAYTAPMLIPLHSISHDIIILTWRCTYVH